jgi:hypothetical protein
MAKSLWAERDRQEILGRLARLTPQAQPLWGTMNASRMLMHLIGWMEMMSGEMPIASRELILRYPGIKHFAIYWMPWPKGLPTAPELITAESKDWAADHARLTEYYRTFDARRATKKWPEHPAFGKLSTDTWGVLGYRHTDHHLRQFGL